MNYYDGNTVTGLWNYAKHFAMSDNFFGTTFGPSAPGAINLVSGDTGDVGLQINGADTDGDTVPDGQGGYSLIEDAQPYYDDCSTRDAVSLTGTNIGDELNAAGLSWGWFQGGFRPDHDLRQAPALTGASQPTSTFIPDQFKGKFATRTTGPRLLRPGPVQRGAPGRRSRSAATATYGEQGRLHPAPRAVPVLRVDCQPAPPAAGVAGGDRHRHAVYVAGVPQFNTANHQYDMSDFDSLVGAISHGYLSPDHLPAVSFLKAPGYQDGHAGYSDPFDEQQFVTTEINALEQTPDWSSTAVIITYDDSDGWYDHVYSGVHNPSNTSGVANTARPAGLPHRQRLCGTGTPLAGQNGRCGYGPRLPLLVISPWAKRATVDHTLTDPARSTSSSRTTGACPGSPARSTRSPDR